MLQVQGKVLKADVLPTRRLQATSSHIVIFSTPQLGSSSSYPFTFS
jgi:hypothetical protein